MWCECLSEELLQMSNDFNERLKELPFSTTCAISLVLPFFITADVSVFSFSHTTDIRTFAFWHISKTFCTSLVEAGWADQGCVHTGLSVKTATRWSQWATRKQELCPEFLYIVKKKKNRVRTISQWINVLYQFIHKIHTNVCWHVNLTVTWGHTN